MNLDKLSFGKSVEGLAQMNDKDHPFQCLNNSVVNQFSQDAADDLRRKIQVELMFGQLLSHIERM